MITFSEIANQVGDTVILMKSNAAKAAILVAVLWCVHFLNTLVNRKLNLLGIWPRHISGLKGIIFSPFLHADFNHLFFNSIPFFLLTDFMFIATGRNFWLISALIILLSGILTWLIGRNAIHIGASGLIMGYWGFLIALTFYEPSVFNVIICAIMLYYLAGLILNLFPAGESTSFEGHIAGLGAGVAVAFLWIISDGNVVPYLKNLIGRLH